VGLGLIYVYLFLNKKLPTFAKVALSLMIAGCFGNLVDRIGYWGQFGIYKKGVIDFIHFSFWDTFPVFNLADSYLVVGIAVLAVGYIISSIVGKKEANEMSKKDTSDVSDADLLNKVRKNDSLTKKDGSEHDGKTNV
jgi:lipoprotein signal peptidase